MAKRIVYMCTLLYRACWPGDCWGYLTGTNPFSHIAAARWLMAGFQYFHIHMMTSSMETFSALLAVCVGNSPVTGEFPAQRPVTRGLNAFFYLRLNKREAGDLRRHCDHYDVTVMQLSDLQTNCSDVILMTGYQVLVPIMSARLHAPMGRVSSHVIRVLLPYRMTTISVHL